MSNATNQKQLYDFTAYGKETSAVVYPASNNGSSLNWVDTQNMRATMLSILQSVWLTKTTTNWLLYAAIATGALVLCGCGGVIYYNKHKKGANK